MTQPSTRVGQSVADLRKLRGLTTRQLSDRLDQLGHRIPQSSISKIEAGKRTVDADDLVALAIALGTTPNRLLFGGRAWTEAVALTPKVSTTGHRAWAWANGDFPLTSTYPDGMTEPEVIDDFWRHARPTDLRLRRQHPASRAARRLAGVIDNLIMFLTSDGSSGALDYLPTPDGPELFRRKDPARGRAELELGVDPAAVVGQALRRTNREVDELLAEAGGEVAPS